MSDIKWCDMKPGNLYRSGDLIAFVVRRDAEVERPSHPRQKKCADKTYIKAILIDYDGQRTTTWYPYNNGGGKLEVKSWYPWEHCSGFTLIDKV